MKKEEIHKPEYRYAGKETLTELIGRTFPRRLIPTKRMGFLFGFLFLITLILAIFQFPFNSLIAGDANISIEIGYPYPYFDFGLTNVEKSPLNLPGLLIDMLLYLIIAYLLDIATTLFLENPLMASEEEKEKHLKIFKDQKQDNISDAVTKKIFKK